MRDVMSAPAITLPADATAGDAALVMAQRGIRHVVVVDGAGRSPASSPSATSSACSACRCASSRRPIRRAADIPALVQCAADVRALSHVAGRAGRGRRAADADDLEPQRPARRADPRADGAGARPRGPGAVLARDGLRGPRRADDRDRPGQRPHLRRQRRGHARPTRPRAAAAVRARRQRGAGPLRLSAVQGRRHGDESALVREPRRVEGRVRELDRPGRSGEPARRQHLLRLPRAVGRAAARRRAARRHRAARAGRTRDS